ncbi:NADPH cytochrome P450 reductase [Trichuris trichiura]|uniref:NADPH cytochrome P450 reductase n=1 Tax=Trichuris trichiura TaxID=36087 RepID=A0A077ZGT8_TRITR|nr:NADPH cytochrome P450 reductase [Trichuris trichiura]
MSEDVTLNWTGSWLSVLDCVILILVIMLSMFYYLYSQYEHERHKLMPSFNPIVSSNINNGFERGSVAGMMKTSGKNMLIFYGSQTGTAEDFAFRLAKDALRYGMKAIALDPEEFDMEELHLLTEIPNSLVVFCLATYGEGDPTDNARDLHEYLQRAQADLCNLNYAVFGLGNKTYEHFNAMARFVDKKLAKLGANRISELGLGDDDANIEEDFMLWKNEFWTSVCKHFNITAVTAEVSMREYKLTVFDPSETIELFSGEVARLNSYKIQRAPFHHKNPFLAPLKVNRDLHCYEERTCRHIEFSLVGSRLRYEAGDHLAVYPRNDPLLVEKFSQLLGIDLDSVIALTSIDPDSRKRTPFPCPCSYRTALSFYVDITSPPRMHVIKEIIQHCSDLDEKRVLQSMVTMTEESRKKYLSWIVADQRGILDIMIDLPSCRPPLDLLLELLPRLQPRYYSISSSPKIDPDTVSITAAVVRYVTPLGRIRKGVATNYLASLQRGDGFPVPKVGWSSRLLH